MMLPEEGSWQHAHCPHSEKCLLRYSGSEGSNSFGDLNLELMSENSVFAVRSNFTTENKPRRNGKPWCDHWNKTGHIKEVYWEIHGKPANWKPRQPRGNRGQRETYASRNLINAQVQQKHTGTGVMAQAGNPMTALHAQIGKFDA